MRVQWTPGKWLDLVLIQQPDEGVEMRSQPAGRRFSIHPEEVQTLEEVVHPLRRILQPDGIGSTAREAVDAESQPGIWRSDPPRYTSCPVVSSSTGSSGHRQRRRTRSWLTTRTKWLTQSHQGIGRGSWLQTWDFLAAGQKWNEEVYQVQGEGRQGPSRRGRCPWTPSPSVPVRTRSHPKCHFQ
ncbi:hypothetical protein VTN96DRAFT_7727 [Rasamsonia emersonii]